MTKVSVVIPVYNGWDLLKRNIDSLLQFEGENILEIIVVDDCSPKSNPYHFNESMVSIIKNNRNLGYTGTVNNGLKKAKGEVILLLDSDACLCSPIIRHLNRLYHTDETIGCIGFAARGENGNATGSYHYLSTVFGYIIGQVLDFKLNKLVSNKSDYLLPLSCCVSFRKKCLEELNYFDEETFPVLEADTDLGIRIHQSSWKLLYEKEVVVIHEGGNSYKVDSKRVRMFHQAKWKLFRKHKMIKNASLVRLLLSNRIKMEIVVLYLLKALKGKDQVTEKLHGRKLLLKEVRQY